MRGKSVNKLIIKVLSLMMVVCMACAAGCSKGTASVKETDDTVEETTDVVETEPQETEKPTNGEPETKAPTGTSDKVNYTATCKSNSSWESNGKKYYQYSCVITNSTSMILDGWKLSITIPSGCSIDSSWNATVAVNGTTLTISPSDWNSQIAANSSTEVCGFIISSASQMSDLVYNGTGNAASGDSNQGGNNNQGGGNSQVEVPTEEIKPYEPPKLESGTPVANHGALSVKGVNLVDKNGKNYQLKGISTHGLQWFPQYVTKDTFKYFRDNWGANMIRLAMYTDENGYLSQPANMENIVMQGVEICTELGMYVIIDWHILHDGNPNSNKTQAKEFFARMAKRYASNTNVIYEICNEPNGGVSWADIKSYADEVIPVIRQYDKDAIIIVGTPTWSQDVEQVAGNPLKKENQSNVMYAVHFYAATHGDNIRNKVVQALNAGTPVFISEFSICDASGNGGIDYNSAAAWKALFEKYNLSYACWNLSNKAETSSLIRSGNNKLSGWTTEELSDTGRWMRSLISGQ